MTAESPRKRRKVALFEAMLVRENSREEKHENELRVYQVRGHASKDLDSEKT